MKRLITVMYLLSNFGFFQPASGYEGKRIDYREAPHGGQFLIQLGKTNYAEIVIRTHEINIYILDKNLGALSPRDRSGTLAVALDGKSFYEYPLMQTESFLKANIGSEHADKLNGTVTLFINGKSYISQFEWQKHTHGVKDFEPTPQPVKNKR